jgi:tetratricopeptide (TPR) repeat protein
VADGRAKPPGARAGEPLEEKPASAPPNRLESWKEIAAYLKRGVSTVQRWEKQEGLPVHRLQHDKGSSVYAYKAEVDAWWHNGHSQLEAGDEEEKQAPETAAPVTVSDNGDGRSHVESQEPEAESQSSFRLPRWRMWLAGAAVAAVVLTAMAVYRIVLRPSVPLHFQSHDVILIASFENRTGESLFDGTVEASLAQELTNSQFVSVAPRTRINDTLALMRKPASTRVDAALGREICIRDGGIRAMVIGRVDKLGSTYTVGAQLVDPISGRTVASLEEEANGQAGILAAVRRLSDRLRLTLGERLSQVRQSDVSLQKVTTPSLQALQLYTQADTDIGMSNFAAAYELLKQAIADDPNFASAYIMAAYALGNQDKPPSEYMPYAKKAMELAGEATPAERYFIEGSYYQMSNQPDRAVGAYEALLQIDPTHYWGGNNLSSIYQVQGRTQELSDLAIHLANVRPKSLTTNVLAAFCLSVLEQNHTQAQPYIDRARALLSANSRLANQWSAPWLQLYPAYQAWMRDDIELARTDLTRALQNPLARGGLNSSRDYGFFSLALGQTRKAKFWFQNVSPEDPMDYEANFAILALARKDRAELRSSLRRMSRLSEVGLVTVSLMIREGILQEAATYVRRYSGSRPAAEASPQLKLLIGELLVARGETQRGMLLLRQGVEGTREAAIPVYFPGAESLAQAYEERGDLSNALQVLEEASANRARVSNEIAMSGAVLWMQDQMDLARLYRRLGRVQDAEKIETELRKLLTYADPDFPMLVELKKLQKAPKN